MSNNERELSQEEIQQLLEVLQTRFTKNMHRHNGIQWEDVKARLEQYPQKMWSLQQMEATGGEPDVVAYDEETREYIFYDCAAESPRGRRSLCYDRQALEARKQNKPENSAIDFVNEIGIDILNEEEYRYLQTLGPFDTKTSSWLKTPVEIRKLGGAIFGDYRYGHVFVYHNGADSYYAARGVRGSLRV